MTAAKWTRNFILFLTLLLVSCMMMTAVIDPFFHYHAPLAGFYYKLDNERSQNNGIIRHFDYDAVITGTSVTENFKTSEFDRLFHAKAIKVSFSGATYKEIGENLRLACSTRKVRYTVRSLDDSYLIADKDAERFDLGEYPTYLYDKNPFNDTKYLLNLDVLGQYIAPMLLRRIRGGRGGVESFDVYANWSAGVRYGREAVIGARKPYPSHVLQEELSPAEKEEEIRNLQQNVLSLAKEFPDTEFYVFFPPYSVVWWGDRYAEGSLKKMVTAQEVAISKMLSCKNIQIYGFTTDLEVMTDLQNYRDAGHYGEWINSRILQEMAKKDSHFHVTKENAKEYGASLQKLLLSYPYDQIITQ